MLSVQTEASQEAPSVSALWRLLLLSPERELSLGRLASGDIGITSWLGLPYFGGTNFLYCWRLNFRWLSKMMALREHIVLVLLSYQLDTILSQSSHSHQDISHIFGRLLVRSTNHKNHYLHCRLLD